MKVIKTWATIHFTEGESTIEAALNYQQKSYVLTHGNNDQNVTFTNEVDKGKIQNSIDRNKCVAAALKYISNELNLK